MSGSLSNTAVLCFVLGWQGGTIHLVAQALDVTTTDIFNADAQRMGELCRIAQSVHRNFVEQKAPLLPGEWISKAQGDADHYFILRDKRWLAAVHINGEMTEQEQLTVLRVMTKAPKLLRAIKNLLDPRYGDTEGRLAEREARQAIKEAEGS